MKIICPACNTSYTIPDRKIPVGKKATATCKKCGNKIEVLPLSETQPGEPDPDAEQTVTAASSTDSRPAITGIDEAIFKEYPDLRSLPPTKFDLRKILIENKKGGYKSRRNKFKVKILKSVSGILPQMLHDGEHVVRVAKGTASYPLEIFLGNGFLTMMYNHYAVICTTMRLLFINIDHRMKNPTHYLFQMTYDEIKKIRRGAFLGSMTFQPKKGIHACRKEIENYSKTSTQLLASSFIWVDTWPGRGYKLQTI